MENLKALFLCNEPSDYFFNGIRHLSDKISGGIKVYHKALNADAPFLLEKFPFEIIESDHVPEDQMRQSILAFNPDIIYVSGWNDSRYLKIAKELKQLRKVVICGMDNAWRGDIRQKIFSLLSTWLVKPYFTHLWVAGKSQYHFARNLQFAKNKILTGVYVANIDNFKPDKNKVYQKELVFVGRFEKIKGVDMLYEMFASLNAQERNDWKLLMIGNGSMRDSFSSSDTIRILPFLQPSELRKATEHAGGFILPSHFEPWGVVVHEFAAAGLPLILSDAVHSGEAFLIPNANGFTFKSEDRDDLRKTLIRFFKLPMEEIVSMGERSLELANRYSPERWASTFLSVYHKG